MGLEKIKGIEFQIQNNKKINQRISDKTRSDLIKYGAFVLRQTTKKPILICFAISKCLYDEFLKFENHGST